MYVYQSENALPFAGRFHIRRRFPSRRPFLTSVGVIKAPPTRMSLLLRYVRRRCLGAQENQSRLQIFIGWDAEEGAAKRVVTGTKTTVVRRT